MCLQQPESILLISPDDWRGVCTVSNRPSLEQLACTLCWATNRDIGWRAPEPKGGRWIGRGDQIHVRATGAYSTHAVTQSHFAVFKVQQDVCCVQLGLWRTCHLADSASEAFRHMAQAASRFARPEQRLGDGSRQPLWWQWLSRRSHYHRLSIIWQFDYWKRQSRCRAPFDSNLAYPGLCPG
jgi:hypothetical protein